MTIDLMASQSRGDHDTGGRPGAGRRRRSIRWPFTRTLIQAAIVACFLAGWQYLPEVPGVKDSVKWLNPFFISSPSGALKTVWQLGRGQVQAVSLWSDLGTTVGSAVLGAVLGLILGALVGLVLSNSRALSEVGRPFIVLMNTVPLVAVIPIIVIIVGPTIAASVAAVTVAVFFLAFHSAYEGGLSIQQSMIDNAVLLGASKFAVMRTIRLPQVAIWTFAIVPNAISAGLLGSVFTELLTGIPGMGTLVQSAIVNLDSKLMFAVVLILAVVGLLLYWLTRKLRSMVIRWDR
jgi:NitT/TauT family transport system permease protein